MLLDGTPFGDKAPLLWDQGLLYAGSGLVRLDTTGVADEGFEIELLRAIGAKWPIGGDDEVGFGSEGRCAQLPANAVLFEACLDGLCLDKLVFGSYGIKVLKAEGEDDNPVVVCDGRDFGISTAIAWFGMLLEVAVETLKLFLLGT